MGLRILYLQSSLSINGRYSFVGRKLYDAFKEIAEDCLLGYIVLPNKDGQSITDPRIHEDNITEEMIKNLKPNVIYIEGGLFANEGGQWKIPRPIAEEIVSSGAIMIISDAASQLDLIEYKKHYCDAGSFLGSSVKYKSETARQPIYGADTKYHWKSDRQIICKPEKMIISDWLKPIYKGISEILVVGPVKLDTFKNILASGNDGSTGTLYSDVWFIEFDCCPFASVTKLGRGYVVFIAGGVSSDTYVEICPDNVKWLINIIKYLHEDIAKEKRLKEKIPEKSKEKLISTETESIENISDYIGQINKHLIKDEKVIGSKMVKKLHQFIRDKKVKVSNKELKSILILYEQSVNKLVNENIDSLSADGWDYLHRLILSIKNDSFKPHLKKILKFVEKPENKLKYNKLRAAVRQTYGGYFDVIGQDDLKKMGEILGDMQKGIQDINETIGEYLPKIEERQVEVETYLKDHLKQIEIILMEQMKGDWDRIKDAWHQYKDGAYSFTELIKKGAKNLGKKATKKFIKTITGGLIEP